MNSVMTENIHTDVVNWVYTWEREVAGRWVNRTVKSVGIK